jgi:hypothetical protein
MWTYHFLGDDPVVSMAGIVKETLTKGLWLNEHIQDSLLILGWLNRLKRPRTYNKAPSISFRTPLNTPYDFSSMVTLPYLHCF